MFVDKVNVKIKAGNGGNGCVSFYRAKYVVNGGPDGGDGGKGGDVVFVTDTGLTTLMDFRYKRTFAAEAGQDGAKSNRSGKSGEDIIIKVPVGTIVREANSGQIMADLAAPGEEKVLAKGGKGGKGNQHFATPTRQAPRYAEQGRIGKEYDVVLELKLIADVGLIGFPNVGKSTFLAMATNANPKIANYHFTTLAPNLGVVRSRWGEDFILADIPGLIEGASEGVGLGHDFLRHVERTKAFVHIVDASGMEGDPVDNIEKINRELEKYNPKLLDRPQIIVANKMDLPESEENYSLIEEYCKSKGYQVYPASAAINEGIDPVLSAVAKVLKNYPANIVFEEDFEEYKEAVVDTEPFTITVTDDNVYMVTGVGVEKMIGYTNIDTEKGFAFFQRYLREKGIIDALEEKGIAEGDTVAISNLYFDYFK